METRSGFIVELAFFSSEDANEMTKNSLTYLFILASMLISAAGKVEAYQRKTQAMFVLVSSESAQQAPKPSVINESGAIAGPIPLLMSEQRDDQFQLLPLKSPVAQFLTYIEEAMQRKISIKYYPWKRVLLSGENGEGIIFGIYKTKEREQIFTFSEPVYSDFVYLVMRCDAAFKFKTIADLKGKTIGMSPGASAGDEFDREVGVTIKPEYNSSSLAGQFSKLYQKRVDAFLYFEFSNNVERIQADINRRYAFSLDEYKIRKTDIFCVAPQALVNQENYFAISKKQDKSTLNELNKVLLNARRNGDLEKIFMGHSQ